MNSENIKKGQMVKVDFVGQVDHIRDGYVQVRNSEGWVLAPVEVLMEMEEPKGVA